MNLILLGTGTSTGIPEVGCNCMHCQSSDPRDKRLRTSALLISQSGTRILIDCGPDFRQQANHIGLEHIDAIVLTHEHYDHVYGIKKSLSMDKQMFLMLFAIECTMYLAQTLILGHPSFL